MFFEIISVAFDASDEGRTAQQAHNLEMELNNEFRGLLIEADNSDEVPELVETLARVPLVDIMVKPVNPFSKLTSN